MMSQNQNAASVGKAKGLAVSNHVQTCNPQFFQECALSPDYFNRGLYTFCPNVSTMILISTFVLCLLSQESFTLPHLHDYFPGSMGNKGNGDILIHIVKCEPTAVLFLVIR